MQVGQDTWCSVISTLLSLIWNPMYLKRNLTCMSCFWDTHTCLTLSSERNSMMFTKLIFFLQIWVFKYVLIQRSFFVHLWRLLLDIHGQVEKSCDLRKEISISFCCCLATGMNETRSLNLKTVSFFLIDWLPDNILELPEEARLLRLLLCNFKTVKKVESKIKFVQVSYRWR